MGRLDDWVVHFVRVYSKVDKSCVDRGTKGERKDRKDDGEVGSGMAAVL